MPANSCPFKYTFTPYYQTGPKGNSLLAVQFLLISFDIILISKLYYYGKDR